MSYDNQTLINKGTFYGHQGPQPSRINKRNQERQRCLTWNWPRRILDFIQSYLTNCCIHGFAYLVKPSLILIEHLFWFLLLVASIYFCIVVCLSSVDRYYTKSTHVGLERNYHFWNTTLPSLTVCPMHRLNRTFFNDYCRSNNIKEENKLHFWIFLENLANSTYLNFQNIPDFPTIDETLDRLNIKPEDYMSLIYNLTYDSTYEPIEKERTRSIDGPNFIHTRQVLTEYGLCYLGNSYLGEEYSSRYLIFGEYPEKNNFENEKRLLKVQIGSFFEKDVGYTLLGFPYDAVDSFIHSPFEVMKVDNNFGYTDEGATYDPETQEIIAEDDFETSATISQRKCRFYHETNLTHFPFYTRNICQQECRLKLAHRICKCIPHFYPNKIAKPKPVCSYKVLKSCFPPEAPYFLKLYKGTGKNYRSENCRCDQNCLDSVVNVKSAMVMKSSKQLLGSVGISISMKTWPQSRLKRQVIFSFTDLLVSIGGTAGLFLGFSVLGILEFAYFFTLRLIFQMLGYKL